MEKRGGSGGKLHRSSSISAAVPFKKLLSSIKSSKSQKSLQSGQQQQHSVQIIKTLSGAVCVAVLSLKAVS
jgi:hypothetical protein